MNARTRATHRDPRLLGVVFVGGMVGTGLRYLMSMIVPSYWGLPWSTVSDNLIGSFLLGLLLQTLVLRGAETPARRLTRLGLGTGVLGGFTTFSQFALDLDALLGAGRLLPAFGYLIVSVGGGLVAASLGMVLASRMRR